MTRRIFLITAGAYLLAACLSAGTPETATEIIRKSDQLLRGKTLQATLTMQIITPDWQRSLKFSFVSQGKEKSFIRIEKPAKDRGVSFLRIGNEMWQYIPKINRVIKIPPSMMLRSWMGSDFTNDDLVKESSIVDDYEHRLLGMETVDGVPVYRIELTPRPDAVVVWGKIISLIRTQDYIPVEQLFFNERGEQVRRMTFSEIRRMGDRTIPTRMEVVTRKKPDNKTVLIYEKALFDRPVKSNIFTQQYLRRARR